jgi:alkylated DNA repair protein (DNA oxidative demethylase)
MGCEGFRLIRNALTADEQSRLLALVLKITAQAPFFQPTMPKTGRPLSVRMSNAGTLGWVSDKAGYRYQATHPVTGKAWPAMPKMLLQLWDQHADYAAPPEACLINLYPAGSKMGSHQDRDEEDFAAPVLSVSLGDDAMFHVGGRHRAACKERWRLHSGDVVVLGGQARLAYHGIDRVYAGTSPLLPEGGRINLTLRRVTKPAPAATRGGSKETRG